jgi:hypothetical protein
MQMSTAFVATCYRSAMNVEHIKRPEPHGHLWISPEESLDPVSWRDSFSIGFVAANYANTHFFQ